jgi:Fe-S-cluster-containing dehydrogenase component
MTRTKVYALPNLVTPNSPVVFDEDVCIGCNRCVEACMSDIFVPSPHKGAPQSFCTRMNATMAAPALWSALYETREQSGSTGH